jgi:Ethanolamine utilization protein EutJ (predicted chaperonin)
MNKQMQALAEKAGMYVDLNGGKTGISVIENSLEQHQHFERKVISVC